MKNIIRKRSIKADTKYFCEIILLYLNEQFKYNLIQTFQPSLSDHHQCL